MGGNFLHSKLSTQSDFRQFSDFVIRAAIQLGFFRLRVFRIRNLADSSRYSLRILEDNYEDREKWNISIFFC